MAGSNPGDKNFDWKLVGIVFTTCRIGISGLILNLRAMGLTYSIYRNWSIILKNFDLYLLIVMDIVSFSEREYFFLGMIKYLSILLRHAVAFVLVTINQKSSTYVQHSN